MLYLKLAICPLEAQFAGAFAVLTDATVQTLAKTLRDLNWGGFEIGASVLVPFLGAPLKLQYASVTDEVSGQFEFTSFKGVLVATAWETAVVRLG